MRFRYTGREIEEGLKKLADINTGELLSLDDRLTDLVEKWRAAYEKFRADNEADGETPVVEPVTADSISLLFLDNQLDDTDDLEELGEAIEALWSTARRLRSALRQQRAILAEIVRNTEAEFWLTAGQLALIGIISDVPLKNL